MHIRYRCIEHYVFIVLCANTVITIIIFIGSPLEFKMHLSKHNLGDGFIPRYRGNRLHIVFNLCGKYFAHHEVFLELLRSGTELGGLRGALLADFSNRVTIMEFQVLGLVGKLLTGPWMKKFYTSYLDESHHIDGINTVKTVLQALKAQVDCPLDVLSAKKDFFGTTLDPESDQILSKLQSQPAQDQSPLFEYMMSAVLSSIIDVIERQYSRYFSMELTETLKKETASARSHNIDSEEVMGMFSAAKQKSPNATLHFTSSKIRAQKNKITKYLDSLAEEKRQSVINFAMKYSRNRRVAKKKKRKDLFEELKARAAAKRQKKSMAQLKQVEKKIFYLLLVQFHMLILR